MVAAFFQLLRESPGDLHFLRFGVAENLVLRYFQTTSLRESSRLVEDDGIETTRFLERLTTAFNKDSVSSSESSADEQRCRSGKRQTARTRDDKHRNGKFQAPKPPPAAGNVEIVRGQSAGKTQRKPDKESRDRDERDDRHEVRSKQISNSFQRRASALALAHHGDNLVQHRRTANGRDLNLHGLPDVDGAGVHLLAGGFLHGSRFAGERAFVELVGTRRTSDDAVGRGRRAVRDADGISDLEQVDVNASDRVYFIVVVCNRALDQEGLGWSQLAQRRNRVSRLGFAVCFHEPTSEDEQGEENHGVEVGGAVRSRRLGLTRRSVGDQNRQRRHIRHSGTGGNQQVHAAEAAEPAQEGNSAARTPESVDFLHGAHVEDVGAVEHHRGCHDEERPFHARHAAGPDGLLEVHSNGVVGGHETHEDHAKYKGRDGDGEHEEKTTQHSTSFV